MTELIREVICPNCSGTIIILELNCCIFRHGVFKNSLEQVNPHAPKEECDRLVEAKLIWGCGQPFKLIEQNNTLVAIKCDYI